MPEQAECARREVADESMSKRNRERESQREKREAKKRASESQVFQVEQGQRKGQGKGCDSSMKARRARKWVRGESGGCDGCPSRRREEEEEEEEGRATSTLPACTGNRLNDVIVRAFN